jgi:hypothetical protein
VTERIALPGILFTFILCVILRACGVKRPGDLFFRIMAVMLGLFITFITLILLVCLWPNLCGITIVLTAYLFNAVIGKLLIGN